MLILVNLIWFQCLLLLLLGFVKMFARTSRLTLPCVLLISIGQLLITQLLMLLWLSKNLFIIVILLLISLDHIYYSFKPKWRFSNDVRLATTPIGQNQLHVIMDKFSNDFSNLTNKVLSNKTKQGVGITRMEETLLPCEYKMEVTCHQDPISYIWEVNF